jgi:aminopeptidase N
VDALHYVFRLTFNDASDEIAGEATVDLRFVKDEVTGFALDLASVANGKGMTVSEVTGGGAPVRYKHESGRLRITLPSPPAAGERRQFTVRYHGVPAGGLRIGTNKYGERTFFSQNWPDKARQWLPTIDHPYDKATSEFIITAPSRYQVVANGLLQSQTDLGDGRRRTHWKQSVPIASWLNAVGVAQFVWRQFDVIQGIPLQTWVFHQDRDAGIVTFEIPARHALQFYSDHIGPYPYEKLASVEAIIPGGGMENASAIFYSERTVGNHPADNLVAHEVAHQWFGDSVTEKDWDDVWLSEGFATYFSWLCTEHYDGREAFVVALKRSRENVFAVEKKNPGVAVVHDNLSDMNQVLNQIVYQKGGWTLHMLRGVMGTDRFWTGIRNYYRRYRDSNASTADFRKVMEENAGIDLSWFFGEWLNRAGSPVIDGGWRYDAAAKRIEIELAQRQAGDPYRLPIEVGIGKGRIERIEMIQKEQRFQIPADEEPSSVVLDPNCWVLMNTHFAKR